MITNCVVERNYVGAVGEVLKIRGRLRGLTQVELSREAGVKQLIVSLVENGRRTYSPDALARVVDPLGTKLGTIMSNGGVDLRGGTELCVRIITNVS